RIPLHSPTRRSSDLRRNTSARELAVLSFWSALIGTDFTASNAFSETLKSPFSATANWHLISKGPKAVGSDARARSMVLLAISKLDRKSTRLNSSHQI